MSGPLEPVVHLGDGHLHRVFRRQVCVPRARRERVRGPAHARLHPSHPRSGSAFGRVETASRRAVGSRTVRTTNGWSAQTARSKFTSASPTGSANDPSAAAARSSSRCPAAGNTARPRNPWSARYGNWSADRHASQRRGGPGSRRPRSGWVGAVSRWWRDSSPSAQNGCRCHGCRGRSACRARAARVPGPVDRHAADVQRGHRLGHAPRAVLVPLERGHDRRRGRALPDVPEETGVGADLDERRGTQFRRPRDAAENRTGSRKFRHQYPAPKRAAG